MSTVEPTKFVGKLDVATCQTVETIRLFFGQRDLVAVHTLAAAAHQVLVDVAHKRGVTSMLKGSADSSLSKDREHLRNINFPFNFFKHAKSDIDEHINIVPLDRFTQDCMMDNVLMLQKLSFSLRLEAKVYWAWYTSRYESEYDDLPEDGAARRIMALNAGAMSFEEISQLLIFNEITTTGGDSTPPKP